MPPLAARTPTIRPHSAGQDDTEQLVAVMAAMADHIHNGIHGSDAIDSMANLDLSVSQFRALFAMCKSSELLAIHDLAGLISLSIAASGRCVDRLVELDLVERANDPLDRRVRRVRLTPAGRDVLGQLAASQRAAFRTFAIGLAPQDRKLLAATLGTVLHHCGASDLTTTCAPEQESSR